MLKKSKNNVSKLIKKFKITSEINPFLKIIKQTKQTPYMKGIVK
jgi:hypothetical protein